MSREVVRSSSVTGGMVFTKEHMMKLGTGVIAAAIFAFAAVAFAQTKPDFSGTWTPDPAAGSGGGAGGPVTVKHTGDTLVVERTRGQRGLVTITYKLDGSEQKVADGMAVVSAKWDGDKIVINTKADESTRTETWSLDGGVLTIERSGISGPRGQAGNRGPSSTKYKKSQI